MAAVQAVGDDAAEGGAAGVAADAEVMQRSGTGKERESDKDTGKSRDSECGVAGGDWLETQRRMFRRFASEQPTLNLDTPTSEW